MEMIYCVRCNVVCSGSVGVLCCWLSISSQLSRCVVVGAIVVVAVGLLLLLLLYCPLPLLSSFTTMSQSHRSSLSQPHLSLSVSLQQPSLAHSQTLRLSVIAAMPIAYNELSSVVPVQQHSINSTQSSL